MRTQAFVRETSNLCVKKYLEIYKLIYIYENVLRFSLLLDIWCIEADILKGVIRGNDNS